ncbi:MAG: hypothetical protein JXA33_11760, partial [Anaerolineae bacterium]|nr:hypothetical protein [Anaerolineae bacterium]
MSFALYDAATGGALIWGPENHTAVPVSDGLFSVGLGSQTAGGIPTSAWNGDRYLEITVGGETLNPRELIRSVPIAGMALTVPDGAINGEQIGTSFGSSSKELLNYVVRNISTTPDLELNNNYDIFTDWDVSSIVGDSAVAVIVYVRINDDTEGSYVQLRKPGTSGNKTAMAGILYSGGYKGYYEFVIPCDGNQTIQYKVLDRGTNPIEVQLWVAGWYEPANR